MQITRRQFVKYISAAATTLGLSQFELQKAVEVLAETGGKRVVWLAGQACTGCTMSFANLWSTPKSGTVDTTVPDGYSVAESHPAYVGFDSLGDVLLDLIDLDAHETLQASAGDLAMDWLRPWSSAAEGSSPTDGGPDLDVLIVEGAIPVNGFDPWGTALIGQDACTIGAEPATKNAAQPEITIRDAVINLATKVVANSGVVLAVGQCASFGGIPAAYADAPDPAQDGAWSGAMGTLAACKPEIDLAGSLVNIPGCPPHPDWIYGTIARYIFSLPLGVDSFGRPTAYYGETIHGPGGCPRYQDYHNGVMASRLGEKGCLAAIGCHGMGTYADCAKRGWNSSRLTLGKKIHCIEAGHPCIGCTQPGYPFKVGSNG